MYGIGGATSEVKKLSRLLEGDIEHFSWLLERYEELAKKYPDMYIAVRLKRVVDCDKDVHSLIEKIKKRYKKIEDIRVYFVSSRKPQLLL